jgi:hypothetical protein
LAEKKGPLKVRPQIKGGNACGDVRQSEYDRFPFVAVWICRESCNTATQNSALAPPPAETETVVIPAITCDSGLVAPQNTHVSLVLMTFSQDFWVILWLDGKG